MLSPADEVLFRHLLWRYTPEELAALPLTRCIRAGELVVGDVTASGEVVAVYPHPEWTGCILVHVVQAGEEGWATHPVARQCAIVYPGPDDPRGRPPTPPGQS